MDNEYKSHPSFGTITILRTSRGGRGTILFGSSIKHHSTISLQINTGQIKRSLKHDWIHSDKKLIEIEMSANQFVDAMTNVNMGDGIPVTIRYVAGDKEIRECPPLEDRKKQVKNEFKTMLNDLLNQIADIHNKLEELKKRPNVSKKAIEELRHKTDILHGHMKSNIPFAEKSFKEQVDKVILEAKSDIEATITNVALRLGSENPQVLLKGVENIFTSKDITPPLLESEAEAETE